MPDFALPRSETQRTLGRMAVAGRRAARDAMDTYVFLRAWLRSPSQTAAIAPSSRALAALITREIDGRSGAVLELGGGTGAFTAALIARGVAESDLTVIEQDSGFAALLTQRYPGSTVLAIDAADLNTVEGELFGAAICGLGLLNMPASQVEAILSAAFARLHPHAALYLFTYGRNCSVPPEVLERLDLIAERTGMTLRNLPPASVFRVERRRIATYR